MSSSPPKIKIDLMGNVFVYFTAIHYTDIFLLKKQTNLIKTFSKQKDAKIYAGTDGDMPKNCIVIEIILESYCKISKPWLPSFC